MNTAIKTEDLSKKYRDVEALNGLNLSIPEGATYALVGPNGAGKTTTLKLLMWRSQSIPPRVGHHLLKMYFLASGQNSFNVLVAIFPRNP